MIMTRQCHPDKDNDKDKIYADRPRCDQYQDPVGNTCTTLGSGFRVRARL